MQLVNYPNTQKKNFSLINKIVIHRETMRPDVALNADSCILYNVQMGNSNNA